jgi:hypothetical protein
VHLMGMGVSNLGEMEETKWQSPKAPMRTGEAPFDICRDCPAVVGFLRMACFVGSMTSFGIYPTILRFTQLRFDKRADILICRHVQSSYS